MSITANSNEVTVLIDEPLILVMACGAQHEGWVSDTVANDTVAQFRTFSGLGDRDIPVAEIAEIIYF